MRKLGAMFFALLFVCFTAIASLAYDKVIFDDDFIRATGSPVLETESFTGVNGTAGTALLKVHNGTEDDSYEKVSSSQIIVNGNNIFASSDFNENVNFLEETISLIDGENTISVLLKGKPGGGLYLTITQEVVESSITGTAAAGAPVRGSVTIKDKNDNTETVLINDDGTFNIEVTSGAPPFILLAEGTVYGEVVKVYSVLESYGYVNITPITDLILMKVKNGDVEALYNNWAQSDFDKLFNEDVPSMEDVVTQQLLPVLSALGVDPAKSLMNEPFETDQTGVDLVLDSIDIKYEGTVVTVTHTMSQISYTDDISLNTATGFTGADPDKIQEIIDTGPDRDKIYESMGDAVDMFATEIPSYDEVDAAMGKYLHEDYLNEGLNKEQKMKWWAQITPNCIGLKIFIHDITPIVDMTPVLAIDQDIERAYTVDTFIKCNNLSKLRRGNIVAFKPNIPAQWLGGRTWLEANIKVQANYYVDYNSPGSATSVIAINLKDFADFNELQDPYAYSQGVRTAKVTGPGLPASGVGMAFGPEPDPVTGHYWMGTRIDSNNLIDIDSLSENSEYEIKLYNDALVEQQILKVIISAPPFSSEVLSASNFPTLTTPSTHTSDEISIPGTHDIEWELPTNIWVTSTRLFWQTPEWKPGAVGKNVIEGDTGVTLDTTGYYYPGFSVSPYQIMLFATDNVSRSYWLYWAFEWGEPKRLIGEYWDIYIPSWQTDKLDSVYFQYISADTFQFVKQDGIQVGLGIIDGNDIQINFTNSEFIDAGCASYSGSISDMTISGSCNLGLIMNFEKSKLYFNNFAPGEFVSPTPTFTWPEYPGADKYFIRISRDNADGTCNEDQSCEYVWSQGDIIETSILYDGSQPLEAGQRYRIKLFARTNSQTGEPDKPLNNYLETFGDLTFYVTN